MEDILQEKAATLKQPLVELKANDENYTNVSIKEANSTFFNTCFNGLNAIAGLGILSVPYALATGGWLSLIFLFIVALSATYSGLLIKRRMTSNPSIENYQDIGQHAFGNIGKSIASITLYANIYLGLTGFLILEGDNLHNLLPELMIQFFGLSINGKSSFIIIIAIIILPTVWLDDMSILSYVSAGGVLASFVMLASVIWVGAVDGVGFENKGDMFNLKGLPTAISLFMLCYDAHTVLPPIYTSMQKKHQFSLALLLCFAVGTLHYSAIAILGYLMFGPTINSQITLNLPTQKIASQVATYTTLVPPLTKYALLLKPVVITTESWFPTHSKFKAFRMMIRTTLVATQVVVALAVPYFGYLMSLVGALLSATISLTIPCLCYLKIYGIRWSVEMVLILGIILFSVVTVVFGTYTSLVHIIAEITTTA